MMKLVYIDLILVRKVLIYLIMNIMLLHRKLKQSSFNSFLFPFHFLYELYTSDLI